MRNDAPIVLAERAALADAVTLADVLAEALALADELAETQEREL